MGLFTWPFEAGDLNGNHFEDVEGLVDTGGSYSLLPASTLRRVGVEPTEIMEFEFGRRHDN